MIEKKYLDILICLKCGGSLKQKQSFLICSKCKKTYDVIHGIPSLVLGKKGIDVELTQDKWGKIYSAQEEKLDLEGQRQLDAFLVFIASFENIFKKGLYLDLACGIAQTAPYLVKKRVSYIGSDISMEGVRKTKLLIEKNHLKGFLIQADFLHIPIKNAGVDSIFWGQALEYVVDTEKAVREVHRVLKPGGTIVATFPVLSLTTLTYQGLRGDIPDIPIVKNFIQWMHVSVLKGKYLHYGYGQSLSAKFVEKMFKKAGFEVEKVDFYDTYYPITFMPEVLKPLARRALRLRPFWPIAYIVGKK